MRRRSHFAARPLQGDGIAPGSHNGKGPLRGLSFSGPVSRILSRATIYLIGKGGPDRAAEAALRPTWTSPSRVIGPAWPCTGRGLPGRRVTATPVRSYRTISPLPVRDSRVAAPSAVYFCGTFPRVSPGGRNPPPCPVVSGLSSRVTSRDCMACPIDVRRCADCVKRGEPR